MARVKIVRWLVKDAARGDITVSVREDDDGQVIDIDNDNAFVTIDPTDVPALLEALQAAADAAKAEGR